MSAVYLSKSTNDGETRYRVITPHGPATADKRTAKEAIESAERVLRPRSKYEIDRKMYWDGDAGRFLPFVNLYTKVLKANPPFRKILRAFEKAKFGYHDFGTIRDKASRKKLYDYYKGDSLTDEQKAIIRAELPTAEFMGSSSQYAPELRRAVVAFPPDRRVRGNPPMYAHHLRERKTHGLNLKQMRRLYAMVSRGNQKAITFARNVLGIPFDETPSQVKAVVKHHVLDLAERKLKRVDWRKNDAYAEGWLKRRLRGNPYISQGGKKVLYGYAKDDIKLLGTGLKISKGELVLLTPATNIPGGGYFARPGYPTGIWKQVSEDDSIYLRPSEIKSDITFRKPVFGSKSFGKMIRGNPSKNFDYHLAMGDTERVKALVKEARRVKYKVRGSVADGIVEIISDDTPAEYVLTATKAPYGWSIRYNKLFWEAP